MADKKSPGLWIETGVDGKFCVVMSGAYGPEKHLPLITPAEDLVAAAEMDYTAYRREIQRLYEEHPLFAERLIQHFLERQLTQGLLEPSRLLALLNEYCESVIADAKMIYRDELLNDVDSYILPAKYKFAVRIQNALQLLDAQDYAGCLPLLTEALHLCPQLSIAVSGLTKYLNELLKNPPQPASPEFAILGGQVKQMLLGLMEAGQWQQAYGVAEQLTALVPGDLDALKLKQEIMGHL